MGACLGQNVAGQQHSTADFAADYIATAHEETKKGNIS